ncbi:NAD(P)-binding domain-containing protein [Roseomonas pecuniae]|uniref:NAD(P)-binding domain-containing protein n=2 Tax=Roseomonas populi TaxID=3121582 RepID=A0ABT1X9R3_9PROT|nr:NAD(P)-binding domain-containing protein [Roseomonas pecuniae]
MRIGIVGTGPVGRTLGTIWARAGHEVAFGSRDPARAAEAAAPRARVVKGFNTVVMRLLREEPGRVRASRAQVFLAGDDAEAKAVVAALAAEMGLGAVDLGGLEAAWMAEALADTFRQGMATSPAGWRQAVVFADLRD